MNKIFLRAEGHTIVAATSAEVEFVQKAEKYDTLPNSSDEMWEHFRPGIRTWSVKHSGFYVAEMANDLASAMLTNADVKFKTHIILSDSVELVGDSHLKDVTIDAPHDALAKFSASIIGDDFPTL